jgi:hypothetical protein
VHALVKTSVAASRPNPLIVGMTLSYQRWVRSLARLIRAPTVAKVRGSRQAITGYRRYVGCAVM